MFQWISKRTANRMASLAIPGILPFLASSCSTPPPPQAYHGSDSSALVIDSVDSDSCKVVSPVQTSVTQTTQVLNQAHLLAQHRTAVVILENYNEPILGSDFRTRTLPLFLGLRGVGFQNIYFLQGRGVTDPNGLLTLARYD